VTKNEAEGLVDELWELVKQGPGRNDSGLRRVRQIKTALLSEPGVNSYVREKVLSAAGWFDYWFTPRRWQQWGEERMRGILNNDVYKIRLAIRSDWPDAPREL
jgi:hypothetical protein